MLQAWDQHVLKTTKWLSMVTNGTILVKVNIGIHHIVVSSYDMDMSTTNYWWQTLNKCYNDIHVGFQCVWYTSWSMLGPK